MPPAATGQVRGLGELSVADTLRSVHQGADQRNVDELGPAAAAHLLAKERLVTLEQRSIEGALPSFDRRQCRASTRDRAATVTRRRLSGGQGVERSPRPREAHSKREPIANRCGERKASTSTSRWRTEAGAAWSLELTAPTRIPCCHEQCGGRETLRSTRSYEIDHAALQRFAQRFERIATELPDLVENQESAMCPCELAGSETGPAADQSRNGEVVVGRAKRRTEASPSVQTGGGAYRTHLGGFVRGEIGKHPVKCARQH